MDNVQEIVFHTLFLNYDLSRNHRQILLWIIEQQPPNQPVYNLRILSRDITCVYEILSLIQYAKKSFFLFQHVTEILMHPNRPIIIKVVGYE